MLRRSEMRSEQSMPYAPTLRETGLVVAGLATVAAHTMFIAALVICVHRT